MTTNQGFIRVLRYLGVLIMKAKDPFKTSFQSYRERREKKEIF